MFFKEINISVYRRMAPANNFSDPTYELVGTIQGTVQPFTGDDSIQSNQVFQNVRDFVTVALDADVRKDDELIYEGETEPRRIEFIQPYTLLIPHKELFLGETQWLR